MSEHYEKDDFRMWLASFEADEQPFQERCPIATWQKDAPEFELYLEALCSDWMWKFVTNVDREITERNGGEMDLDWSSLTAKDTLGILDALELA